MAYYLELDGNGNYVDLDSPISATGDGVLAEFDFVYKGASNDVLCGGTSFSDFWRINNDAQFRISIAGTASNVTINTPLVVGTRYVLKLVRTGISVIVEDGGGNAITPAANFNSAPFIIDKIGSFHNGSSNLAMDLYGFKANNGANNYNKQTLNGSNDTVFPDTTGGNDGTLVNFPTDNSQWIFYDDGGGEPEPELHEFSGNAIVNALSFAQISKSTQYNGQALIDVSARGQFAKSVTLLSDSLVTASATASSTKVINVSGGVTVVAQSVSLFEKLNTFNGAASVIATSQSSASKLVPFNGQATVSVTANASIIDGDLEIHSFSGGALITASASGQAMKVGIVSGSVNVTASISAQASKTALLSGNATVSTSTQSLLSKIANITGNAITRVTTLAAVLKRVTLSGASRVVATASGTFFNAESNVETYELTVQGRVKAPIVVQGRVKSLTIQGRVK